MPNIVIITEEGIDCYKSWYHVRKHTSFKKEDFASHGSDFMLNMTGDSYEVMKDVKLIERVASDKVFSKSTFGFQEILLGITCFFALLAWIGVGSVPSDVVNAISSMKVGIQP